MIVWLNIGLIVGMISGLPNDDSTYYTRLNEGIRLYEADRYLEAARVFKLMHEEYPDSIRVTELLAHIEFAREQWGDARRLYDELIDRNVKLIEAHYRRAVCLREAGKYKGLVLRLRDWRRAERSFNFVLDSLDYYKDTHYQYAVLKKYNDKYDIAVELAEQQLIFEPYIGVYAGLYQFYDSFLHNKGSRAFQQWAIGRTGRRVDLYLGESYRLDKEYERADSVYTKLLADSSSQSSTIPIYIAKAKVQFQMNHPDSTQYYFEQALQGIKNDVDARLMFEHIKYVLSDQEYAEYQSLVAIEDKRSFFRKMWAERNPMPASKTNYRMIEHVRRFIVAESDHFYDGFRLQYNNPDRLNFLRFPKVFDLNDKFNDKGLIYIRHGEPDDRAFEVGDGPLNESWLYRPRGQMNEKLIFHFWQGETQTGNNWRLIPSIPPYLADSRYNFDPMYSRMMTADYLEAMSLEHEMALAGRKDVQVGMNTDQHSWGQEFRSIFFPFYMATFRDDSMSTRSELYYSLNREHVWPSKASYSLEDSVVVNFAVFNKDYLPMLREEKRITVREIVEKSKTIGYWPDQFVFSGIPDRYQFALDLNTPNEEGLGGYKFWFSMFDYNVKSLAMSGIVLAHTIKEADGAGKFSKEGFTVVPNPAKLFSRKQNIHIYFQVYNFPIQSSSLPFFIEYRVKLLQEKNAGLINKIAGMFRNPQPLTSNTVERTAFSESSVEYIALDMKNYVTGIYELLIEIQVPASQDTTSRKINFEIK